MQFSYVDDYLDIPASSAGRAFLVYDRWDDYFEFCTMFTLVLFTSAGVRLQPGNVKIGQVGLVGSREASNGHRAPTVPREFTTLPVGLFSLGQDEDYYQTINQLGEDERVEVLTGLRDCALDLDLFHAIEDERVTTVSLLRSLDASTVRGRFARLARGDATLSSYEFAYLFPSVGDTVAELPRLEFSVVPESVPPTNVHVVVGRNGVGKTRFIRGLSRALSRRVQGSESPQGAVQFIDPDETFSGALLVSFSAFDQLEASAGDDTREQDPGSLRVLQIGLPHLAATGDGRSTIHEELGFEFAKALKGCLTGLRRERWLRTVRHLQSDPLFLEAQTENALDLAEREDGLELARWFSRLSSGHAIVLLMVTSLVHRVNERTLVLLDEPEGHLHPPLLAAFIRALSALLRSRNGVAIVSTHSPVVLQEVPRSCVWKLRRTGATTVCERPHIETFGENVDALTREVFCLEVENSGFNSLLREKLDECTRIDDGEVYQAVTREFGGQLGSEARIILRGLIASRATTAGRE